MQWGTKPALAGLALAVVAWAAPAAAQSTGMVKGKIVDAANQVVEGATVIIETKDGGARRFKVTTNKKGEYIQIGLQPGTWTLTASKDGVGQALAEIKISLGSSEVVDMTLAKGGAAGMSKEEAAKVAAMSKAFEEGVEASKAQNYDLAIAKFTEAKTAQPDCYACAYNIGLAYAGKKDLAKAEEAFLAAAALKPDSPDPYNQLANLFNANKQYDKATAMVAEASKRAGGGAAGGASAESLFNQGVVLWNGGKFAEAKVQFEAAAKAKPDYADAHYWTGMANLNTGAIPAARASFEAYMKYAPTGQYAEDVKKFLAQLPK